MKKLFLFLTMILFAGFTTSCATIMRDNNQNVPIRSNVENVNFKIKNRAGQTIMEGVTPYTVNLKTSQSGYFSPERYTVEASKAGYTPIKREIDWHVSKWYSLGNLGFGFLWGYLLIDPLSGDMYYLDEEVNLEMSPIK